MTAGYLCDGMRTDSVTTMKKQKQTQVWPQGSTEFELILPTAATKTGKIKKSKLSFSKSLVATKPLTAKGWIKWEISQAKDHLEKASLAIKAGKPLTTLQVDDLLDSMAHAVAAWCQAHLLTKHSSSHENSYNAFFRSCPEALKKLILKSISALQRVKYGTVSYVEMLATVNTATEALIEATRRRSRGTRRVRAPRETNQRK